ncbi:MAG: hypothetical protein A3G40_03940 [Deltaproteobacteria bacterium RIFCSPLOWO2_12_FULL_57_22]|nr:MAG: hypothetical protein A3G40_03940 [Deltaproteobacteria bacterium RIFCSPLOWO2_12_FULL_57_22]
MGGAGDLVTAGLVGGLVYPGGNVTGVSSLSPDLSGKRLELVREALLKAIRVAAAKLLILVPGAGVEPARDLATFRDCEPICY